MQELELLAAGNDYAGVLLNPGRLAFSVRWNRFSVLGFAFDRLLTGGVLGVGHRQVLCARGGLTCRGCDKGTLALQRCRATSKPLASGRSCQTWQLPSMFSVFIGVAWGGDFGFYRDHERLDGFCPGGDVHQWNGEDSLVHPCTCSATNTVAATPLTNPCHPGSEL